MSSIPAVKASGASQLGSPGIQLEINDPALQAYLQRYPFASGPDARMNSLGLEQVSAGIRLRPAGTRVTPEFLQPHQTSLPVEEENRAECLLDAIRIPADKKAVHMDDFGWEVNLVPRSASNVLIIGCGNGLELIFLRAVLPSARFTAVDYYKKLLPGLQDAVGVTFIEGDVRHILPTLDQQFDLVFSNHTMEHLYAPNDMLSTLAGLLITGGHILSVMPMVGLEGTPFLEKVRAFAFRSSLDPTATIHPLEIIYFDPGHPWKSNPDDLAATLSASGFTGIRIFQRENHRSRPLQLTPAQYRRKRSWMTLLNRVFIGMPRRLAMLLFPRRVPRRLPALFYAAERRLPFGTNYVMNIFSEEALFLARVDH